QCSPLSVMWLRATHTLSLHDALPICAWSAPVLTSAARATASTVSATSTSSRVNPRCRSALRRRIPHLHAPLQGHLYLAAQFAPRHPQGNDRRRHLTGIAQTDMRFPATGLGQGSVFAIQLQLDLDQILWETARPQLRVLQCMPLAGIVIQHHELEETVAIAAQPQRPVRFAGD